MATTYKVLGQAAPTSTGNVDLFSVGIGASVIVSTISVTNTTSSAATARIFVRVAGANAAQTNALVYDASFPANSTTGITIGLTLSATDKVTVQAGTGNALTFMAFGQEMA